LPKNAEKNQTIAIVTIGTVAAGILITGLLFIFGASHSGAVRDDDKNLARSDVPKPSTPDMATKLKKVQDDVRLARDRAKSIKTTALATIKEAHAKIQNEVRFPPTAKPAKQEKRNGADSPATADTSDNATKPDEGDSDEVMPKSDQPKPTEKPPQATERSKPLDADAQKTASLTGTWKNTGGVQVNITDDGKSIKLQVGETPTLVSLNGSLTRTEKADVLDGTVQIISKADRKRTLINIPVKATLLNPNELHLVYDHWPTYNRMGVRQFEDTKAVDHIKRN